MREASSLAAIAGLSTPELAGNSGLLCQPFILAAFFISRFLTQVVKELLLLFFDRAVPTFKPAYKPNNHQTHAEPGG